MNAVPEVAGDSGLTCFTAGIQSFAFIHEIIHGKRQIIFYITDGCLVRNADLPVGTGTVGDIIAEFTGKFAVVAERQRTAVRIVFMFGIVAVTAVDKTAPFIAEFLDVIQSEQHTVIIFGLAVKAEVVFTVRRIGKFACFYAAGTEPALAAVDFPVIIAAEKISSAFNILMI